MMRAADCATPQKSQRKCQGRFFAIAQLTAADIFKIRSSGCRVSALGLIADAESELFLFFARA
jgi:hypothetical protein